MGKRVLVVDDDPDFLTQTALILRAAGYDVEEATSAAEAAKRVAESPPDLAVVDLMLEDADAGFALSHRIKSEHGGLPVIMLSGVAGETGLAFDAATDEERSWIKVDAFLDKPVRSGDLLHEMRRLMSA